MKLIYATTYRPGNTPFRSREVVVWRNAHYRRYAVRLPGNTRPTGFISLASFTRAVRLAQTGLYAVGRAGAV